MLDSPTLLAAAVVSDASDIQFHSCWGMMQTETNEPNLLDLAARLRSHYAMYGAADGSEGGERPQTKASRMRRIQESGIGLASPYVLPIPDETPGQSDIHDCLLPTSKLPAGGSPRAQDAPASSARKSVPDGPSGASHEMFGDSGPSRHSDAPLCS